MSSCRAIHYSAAVVRQYMAALMFYLKWHVIAVLNLSENMLFEMCKTSKKGNLTIVHCNCVEKHLLEACTTYKIWSILCLHINGSNPEMPLLYSAVLHKIQQMRWPCQCRGRNGFKAFERVKDSSERTMNFICCTS